MVTRSSRSTEIPYADVPSPLGTIWIAATERGLARVSFNVDEESFRDDLGRGFGRLPVHDSAPLAAYIERFTEYFAGERTAFELPLDLRGMTAFQRAVLEEVAAIPYGHVRSYGEIAQAVGKPGAARAVGTVMATNPISLVIPCHRVIRSDGTVGEYSRRLMGPEGRRQKLLLLSLEGVALPLQ